MPEGPEIRRTADLLSEALVDKQTTDIFFAFDRHKKFEGELSGEKIYEVDSRGKAIITRFENGLNIYSHNQLYGKWKVLGKGEEPDTNRKLRLSIGNGKHKALLYSASEIEVLKDEELKEQSYLKKLGPDILHPDTTFQKISHRYNDKYFRNRKVATLLLDQSFLSGIGNYLRAEIMFVAGVDPELKLRDCTDLQKEKMAEASVELPKRSYRTGGITTDPKIVDALKREGSKRSNYRHYVYGRAGKRCHLCGDIVAVVKTGGRKLFYCPDCQKTK